MEFLLRIAGATAHALQRGVKFIFAVLVWLFFFGMILDQTAFVGGEGFALLGVSPPPRAWGFFSLLLGLGVGGLWIFAPRVARWIPKDLRSDCGRWAGWAWCIGAVISINMREGALSPYPIPSPYAFFIVAPCFGVFVVATFIPLIWYWRHREEVNAAKATIEQRAAEIIMPPLPWIRRAD
jgi:hypothetical protein